MSARCRPEVQSVKFDLINLRVRIIVLIFVFKYVDMNIKYTKEILEGVAKDSKSVAEVMRRLDIKVSGGSSSHIRRRLNLYEISTEHFTGQASMTGVVPKSKRTLEQFKNEVLSKNGVDIKSHALKLKLYEFGLREEVCEICNLGNEWNGKKISLHLDHIDGVNNNNELSNLRILCPNCHSQTDTYAGKRSKGKISKEDKLKKIDNHCLDCDCLIGKNAIRCKSCKSTKQANDTRAFNIPDKESLLTMLKQTNFTAVAKKFNVSDNAVRKWCLKYGLPDKSSAYK